MTGRFKTWWKNLGVCLGERSPCGKFRSWGIRPGKHRWFWFIIDDSDSARKKKQF